MIFKAKLFWASSQLAWIAASTVLCDLEMILMKSSILILIRFASRLLTSHEKKYSLLLCTASIMPMGTFLPVTPRSIILTSFYVFLVMCSECWLLACHGFSKMALVSTSLKSGFASNCFRLHCNSPTSFTMYMYSAYWPCLNSFWPRILFSCVKCLNISLIC